uniref:Chromosome 8 open reading frame 74 n=1 Tax=Chelydra serpentina TaxID=8475 RepID=A0A8C3TAY8_CHESE
MNIRPIQLGHWCAETTVYQADQYCLIVSFFSFLDLSVSCLRLALVSGWTPRWVTWETFSFRFFPGLPVSQAICVLKDKLVACEPKLSPFKPCVLCEYFYNTLIRHYQLYQFVLCRERDVEQTSAHLEICVPPQPLPLMAGINAEVWHYQQQLAALSAAEVEKRTNMLLLRETLHLEREHTLQRAYDELKSQAEILDRQILETLVKGVIGTQIQALQEILQTEIQTTFEILELRLQKRALILNPPVPYPPPFPLEERAKKSTKAQEQKKKKK